MVTGSLGFIGSNLCLRLKTEGYEVYGIDIADRKKPIDIRDFNSLKAVFSEVRPQVVVHLAALASVPLAEKDPFEAYGTNVIGTLNVVECANATETKVILASSAAVYGEPTILPTPETALLNPTNVYGATKVAAEQITNLRARKSLTFRLFNVYGPRCYRSYVIPDVARKITKGQVPFQALGTGEEKRDFVYIDDVARAIVLGVEKDIEGIFNVGVGLPISIKDLIRKMCEVAGIAPSVTFAGSTRVGDFNCNWADTSKITNQIGWRPETALEEGLKKTIEWYKNNS